MIVVLKSFKWDVLDIAANGIIADENILSPCSELLVSDPSSFPACVAEYLNRIETSIPIRHPATHDDILLVFQKRLSEQHYNKIFNIITDVDDPNAAVTNAPSEEVLLLRIANAVIKMEIPEPNIHSGKLSEHALDCIHVAHFVDNIIASVDGYNRDVDLKCPLPFSVNNNTGN